MVKSCVHGDVEMDLYAHAVRKIRSLLFNNNKKKSTEVVK